MKNLITRSLTGLAFVAIIISSLLIGKYFYALLFILIIIGGLFEFYRLFNNPDIKPNKTAGYILSGILFVFTFLVNLKIISEKYLLLIVLFLIITFTWELYRKKEKALQNLGVTVLGVLYVALPISLTNYIVFSRTVNNGEYSPLLIIALLSIIWVYDSGAYIFGVTLGRHRLLERISPKKSWEGAIGGTIIALLYSWFIVNFIPQISQISWLIIGFLTVVSSTFGDLTESMFKRNANQKDSGNLFPGHGGILDRFDSLLFAIPVFFVILKIFIE